MSNTNPNDLLARGLEALGLSSTNSSQVNAVTYVGAGLYRTKGVMESYAMVQDVFVATAGSYNISFSYESSQIKQRINAHHQISPYWLFARPNFDPVNFTMVLQGGSEGFAALIGGSNNIWAPDLPPLGYLDGMDLFQPAIREAEKISPFLLSKISSNQNFTLGQETISTGMTLPSVHDNVLNLSVIFDPESHLPLIIRALDYHPLFGPSTYDLLLKNYTRVNGISYPTRFQTILNNKHLIMDYEVRQVLVNPLLNTATFEGPANRSQLQPPVSDSQYSFGEIATWSESYMWYGGWVRTAEDYTFTQPVSELPGLWYMDPGPNPPSYNQMILVFEDSVVVLDAAPHQGLVIIDWVQKTLGRNVTHVWPTHHHGDHAMGLIDYANAGAKVIVLDKAKDYYTGIPEDSILTYTTEEPFSMGDSNMHAKFIHMDNSVHAFDHSYAVITPSCVNDNSSVRFGVTWYCKRHTNPVITQRPACSTRRFRGSGGAR
ncbi:hypothetical protein DL98DRAFT_621263 [Cadophora sp. DSE1049]|nr:hypothetical protein DL98DRAFT_621263 [Cadophora sp. DSE1049]